MAETKELYRELILITFRLRCLIGKVSESYGLTHVQAMVLIMLKPGEPMSMNRLTCRLGCDASNTTGLVDRLELQSMIKRTKDPNDKRISQISLSSNGEACRKELLFKLSEMDNLNLKQLDDEQYSALTAALTRP